MVHPATMAERIHILGYPQSYREVAFLHDLVEDVGKQVEDITSMLLQIENRVSSQSNSAHGAQVALDVYFMTNLFNLVYKRKDRESLLNVELSQTSDERNKFFNNVIHTNRRAQRDFDRANGVKSTAIIPVQIKQDLNSFYRTLTELKAQIPETTPWKNIGEMLYAIYCERIAGECLRRYERGDPNFDMLMTVKLIDSSDNMRTFPNTEMLAIDRLLYKTRTVFDAAAHLIRAIEETEDDDLNYNANDNIRALKEVAQILPLETLIKMSQIIDGIEHHSDTQMKHLITRELVVYDLGEHIRFFGMEDRGYVQKFMKSWEKLPGKGDGSVTRYDGDIKDHEISLNTIGYLRSLLPIIARGAVQELEQRIDNISMINAGKKYDAKSIPGVHPEGQINKSVIDKSVVAESAGPIKALARLRIAHFL